MHLRQFWYRREKLIFAEEKPFSDVVPKIQREYPDQVKTVYIGEDNRFKIFQINYESKSFNQISR